MISLRRTIEETERHETRLQALLKVFGRLVSDLPRVALPADPELSENGRRNLEKAVDGLGIQSPVKAIEQAGQAGSEFIESVCRVNKQAFEERDSALKELLSTVAGTISSLKGRGEKHNTNLARIADEFEGLARIQDPTELRRRLREDAGRLRSAVDEMRREGEESLRQFQDQVTQFQRRIEVARKDASADRLTGLNNRRELERAFQKRVRNEDPFCLLVFDLDSFGSLNKSYGNLAGDQVLKALAYHLRARFPGENTIFRWGADEFVVIQDDLLPMAMDQGRAACADFREREHLLSRNGRQIPVRISVSAGVSQYVRGEALETFYGRARDMLERGKGKLD